MVLDCSHNIFLSPIDGVGNVGSGSLGTGAFGGDSGGEADEMLGTELFSGHVSKGVHFDLIGFKSCLFSDVMCLNKLQILKPDRQSIGFFLGRVGLAIFLLPDLKILIDSLFVSSEGVEGDGGEGQKCK